MTRREFENKCKEVAESCDAEVDFFVDKNKGSDCFEDDGSLHVRLRGFRACFDVSGNQSASGKKQNQTVRKVLAALGMADKIGDRVLVDYEDDDD